MLPHIVLLLALSCMSAGAAGASCSPPSSAMACDPLLVRQISTSDANAQSGEAMEGTTRRQLRAFQFVPTYVDERHPVQTSSCCLPTLGSAGLQDGKGCRVKHLMHWPPQMLALEGRVHEHKLSCSF